ncbi:Retrovirus-related Pol polyprotein from transposon RE1 [Bienertia sinuspersici]
MPESSQTTQSYVFPSKTQDPTSVYYIHPSENPTQPLVTEKFNGDNFADWKRSMIITLAAKNKLCFVDGTLEEPQSTDADYEAWQRCNNLLISYLLRSLDMEIARSVMYFLTAREIWKDLEERYDQSSGPQLYILKKALLDLTQGNSPVTEYFTKMKPIWDQISGIRPLPVCKCGGCSCNLTQQFLTQQHEDRLVQLLMKLDPAYSGIRTNILMMQPLPSISLAYRLLIQEEKQKAVSELNQPVQTMGLAADYKKFDNKFSPKFGSNNQGYKHNNISAYGVGAGQQSKSYASGSKRAGTQITCDYCKFTGHTANRCWKLHGYPPGHPLHRQNQQKLTAVASTEDKAEGSLAQQNFITQEQYAQLMELLNKQNKQNISPDNAEPQANVAGICLLSDLHKQWIIDSGATNHICSNIDLFYDYAKYIRSSDSITIADGKKVKIEHVGTIHFDNSIILTGVLHVPDFKYNLISATKLCQDLKCMITFTHDKCYIQGYSQKTLQVLGELRSGLYAVDGTSPIFHKDKSKAVFLSLSEESKLWH